MPDPSMDPRAVDLTQHMAEEAKSEALAQLQLGMMLFGDYIKAVGEVFDHAVEGATLDSATEDEVTNAIRHAYCCAIDLMNVAPLVTQYVQEVDREAILSDPSPGQTWLTYLQEIRRNGGGAYLDFGEAEQQVAAMMGRIGEPGN